MKHIFISILGIFFLISVSGQTKVVYGKLTSFNTYPVQNVEVRTKKSKSSTITDSLGQFAIVCFENDVIKIKPKTFQSVNRKVGPDTDSLSINLIFVDSKKNRELAIGYGYINQQDLTFAVNNLQQENNEYCSYLNVFDLLRGRFPGVNISGNAVYIRSLNSVNSDTEALYVVDGVISSSIDWILPCEIRSISILKDGSGSIYGTRGGNGVVIIETKY